MCVHACVHACMRACRHVCMFLLLTFEVVYSFDVESMLLTYFMGVMGLLSGYLM